MKDWTHEIVEIGSQDMYFNSKDYMGKKVREDKDETFTSTDDGEGWYFGGCTMELNGEEVHTFFAQVKVKPRSFAEIAPAYDAEFPNTKYPTPNVPREGGHPMFYEILKQMEDIHSRKNADYTGEGDPLSNLRMCEDAGIPAWKGVIVRLGDKYARLNTFAKKESYQVKDESVEDTFLDNAVYSILGLILYRESHGKEEN